MCRSPAPESESKKAAIAALTRSKCREVHARPFREYTSGSATSQPGQRPDSHTAFSVTTSRLIAGCGDRHMPQMSVLKTPKGTHGFI